MGQDGSPLIFSLHSHHHEFLSQGRKSATLCISPEPGVCRSQELRQQVYLNQSKDSFLIEKILMEIFFSHCACFLNIRRARSCALADLGESILSHYEMLIWQQLLTLAGWHSSQKGPKERNTHTWGRHMVSRGDIGFNFQDQKWLLREAIIRTLSAIERIYLKTSK